MSHAPLLVALDAPVDMIRIEERIEEQMAPFYERDGWFKDGSRWDWWQIGGRYSGKFYGGDVIRLSDFDIDCHRQHQISRVKDKWSRIRREKNQDPCLLNLIYGIEPSDSLEKDLEKAAQSEFPTFYAFLRNWRWDEPGRLGWFGMRTATECERAGREDLKRCLYRDGKSEAVICSWNEDDNTFYSRFRERFIQPLDPDTILVTVDYHV